MENQSHIDRNQAASSLLLNGTLRADQTPCQNASNDQRKASLTVIRSGADLGVHVVIDERIVVGRDLHCDITLHDHRVSRQHISITPLSDNRYLVQDLGSTNGTRLNGEQLSVPQLLKNGDKIALGESVIRFELADKIDVDYQSEVSILVSTDPLTGLPSKRRFDESFEFAIQSAIRTAHPIALLMMDMDGLKKINDTHGHLFGAHTISCGGRIIAQVLRGVGQACRFGGDEFSAFLPNHDLTSALEVAEKVRYAIETAGLEKDGIPLRPTISIGAASYPVAGTTTLELTHAADLALYRAKAKGKNCVCS